jgi:asparagine synthase (glutamine-hydrolysing)
MCGIAGAFSKKGINEQLMKQATDAMLHRGPDAGGYFTNDEKNVFLGHRRLSIIDLSTGANQPMISSCGRYVMVYNGEVYNFKELSKKLPNHHWKTHGDTEVILELFAKFGAESFAWLNGMFALAIYDKEIKKIVLSRDHIGIKPLYYYWDEQTFVFASELKVINNYCKNSGIQLSLHKEAIPQFLHLGFIPEPQCIYKHVYKFPSGSHAVIDVASAQFSTKEYWKPSAHFLTNKIDNEQTTLQQYKDLLFASVNDQMVSDVPLGTFLSGGIDSSLVTAVASKLSSQKVKTFSIGFNEAKYDETQFASAVAEHLKTDHHIFKVSVNDVMELVPSLLKVYDEPYADSSAFPTMLVSRLARQYVTVVLSGDGGDEFFQGYGMYTWANRLQQPLFKTFRKPAYALTQLMGNRMKRGGALFNYPSSKRLHTHIFSQEQYYFGESELSNLLKNQRFDFDAINTLDVTNGNAAEQQAYWDLKYYLKDDLLVKVDRASMQYSLESRVPLLDQRIVEFALNLDYNLKVSKEYGTKHLMKQVLYEMVPRTIFERPKRGFAIPLKEWLRGPLHYLIVDNLNKQVVEEFGVVHFHEVEKLVKRFMAGEDFLYNRIWLLVVLHWWLKTNNATR